MKKNILKKLSLVLGILFLLPIFSAVSAEEANENMKIAVYMEEEKAAQSDLFYEQNAIEDIFLYFDKSLLDENKTIPKESNTYIIYAVDLDKNDIKSLNDYFLKNEAEKPTLNTKLSNFVKDLGGLKKAGYKGVVFDFSEASINQDYYDEFLKVAKKTADSAIGLRLNKDNEKLEIDEKDIKILIPNIDVIIERISNHYDYTYYVDAFLKNYKYVNLYFPVTFKKVLSSEVVDIAEIATQLFYLKNKGVKNVVFDTDFSSEEDKNYFTEDLKHWFTTTNRVVPEISQTLSVGRPANNITLTSQTYNIFGTSNPKEDLFVNGKIVEGRGEKGTFSYFANLAMGANTLTFSQPSGSKTIVITRVAPAALSESIDVISKNSMLPLLSDYTYSGGEYNLKCVAPSGGVVSAEIDGVVTKLKQQVATEKDGVPAVYRGKLLFDDEYEKNEIKNIGKIKYKLSFNGVNTEYESKGDLYVAGMETVVGAKSISPMANLYDTLDDVKDYKYSSTLSVGQWDQIINATEDYFQLSMGDYVKKSDVSLIDVNKEDKGKLNAVNYTFNDDSETILLEGVKDHINSFETMEDGSLKITFYNIDTTKLDINKTKTILNKAIMKSHLFEEADLQITENKDENLFSVTLKTKGNNTIWGYQIKSIESKRKYTDAIEIGTIIYFKKNPTPESMRPLQGKIIILDPGHGGYDSGALGTAYEAGPLEKDLSLKTALKTKEYLEGQGAEVFLIRNDDTFIALQERAIINEKIKPDIFVSIHLNSVLETSDGKSSGAEVYYYNENSKLLSENILKSMASNLDREIRGSKYGAYVVARPTITPSVLCEIGFMSNPQEYENMTDESIIDKTGLAISEGIKNTIIQGSLN